MNTCPKCGGEMKYVPSGVSKKTGKPYNAFWSCKNRECGGTANEAQQDINNTMEFLTRREFQEKMTEMRKAFADVLTRLNKLEKERSPKEEPADYEEINVDQLL